MAKQMLANLSEKQIHFKALIKSFSISCGFPNFLARYKVGSKEGVGAPYPPPAMRIRNRPLVYVSVCARLMNQLIFRESSRTYKRME